MPPDILADHFSSLALAASTPPARLDQEPVGYRGSDIPKKAKMLIDLVGPTQSNYSVQFWAPGLKIPSVEFAVTKRTPKKTVAVLRRGKSDPLIASVSGWSEVFSSTHDYLLDNLVWTDEVFAVCEVIGHRLQADWRDKGVPGRYHACHAEKQVLAHVFRHRRRRVALHISSLPCGDCADFIRCFAGFTGIQIAVFFHGVRVMKA